MAQYFCIRELGKRPGQSNADLAKACDLSPQTMTVVVANLEKRELIRRLPDEENLRILRLRLTRDGEALGVAAEEKARSAIPKPLLSERPEAEARAIAAFLQQVASYGE